MGYGCCYGVMEDPLIFKLYIVYFTLMIGVLITLFTFYYMISMSCYEPTYDMNIIELCNNSIDFVIMDVRYEWSTTHLATYLPILSHGTCSG
jgi:hypothetical protein